MATTVLSLLVVATSMVVFNLYNYKTKLTNTVTAHATFLARAVKTAVEFSDIESLSNYVKLMGNQSDILAATVYDLNGDVLSAYGGPQYPSELNPSASPRYEGDSILVSQPIENADGIIGFATVVMHYALTEQLLGNITIATSVTFLSALIALALSIWLQSSITKPVLQVSSLAQRIVQEKDYSLRAEKTSDAETGHMVEAINAMMAEVQRRDQDLANSNFRLETANQELESFSYSVSHDLRTPLRALDGFSQALLEDYDDVLREEGKHYLNRIRVASQRMGVLIDDLLKLSRVSRYDLNLDLVNLSEMAQQVVDELQATEPSRQVDFVIAPDVTSRCDKRMLKIALDNLFHNAWKYSSKQERSRIEFGVEQRGTNVVFYIKDNGVGYDMKYASKLFGAFQRLHTEEEFPGTGIGLATSRRIFRRHGGDIWGESVLGEGATFYFTLSQEKHPNSHSSPQKNNPI